MTWFVRTLLNIAALLLFIQVVPMLIEGIKTTYDYFASPKTRVGVVTINHMLVNANHTVNQLRTFFKDKSIKAILLQMDCPGGYSGSSQALFEELKTLKKEYPKPVVTYVETLCASGGYYVAAASDAIVTTPSAFVGSIGVYIAQPYLKNFIEQYKLQYNFVESGKYKTARNPFAVQSDERKAMLQSVTDDTYQQFIADVVAQRPQLSLAKSTEWAEGRVFTGKQALKLGLIDAVGSLTTAANIIKKKAQFDGEIAWIHPQKKGLFGEWFAQQEDNSIERTACVIQQSLQAVYQQLVQQGMVVQS